MSDVGYIRERVAVLPDGCWIFLGCLDRDGYGKLGRHGRTYLAHRFAYLAFRGPIPADRVLDHVVCDERSCCNPWHVEPRSQAHNTLRSRVALAAINARKSACKWGHEFTPANTRRYVRPDGRVKRVCRTCEVPGV